MYLIAKIALYLIGAFVFGFVLAWLTWRAASMRREREMTSRWERRLGDLQRERDTSMAKLRRELEDHRQQIPTLEASLSDRSDLIARLERDLADWRAKLPDLEKRLREREEHIDTLTGQLVEKSERLDALDGEVEAARSAQARESDETAKVRQESDRLAQSLRERDAAATSRARELGEEVERLRSACDSAARERDEAQNRAQDLRRELDELASSHARLSTQLEDAMRGATADLFGAGGAGAPPDGLLSELPPGRVADDLKQIRGIGPVLERTLNRLGIYFFAQLAGLGEDEVTWVAHQLNTFPGRIERDRWVEQAAQRVTHTHGEG